MDHYERAVVEAAIAHELACRNYHEQRYAAGSSMASLQLERRRLARSLLDSAVDALMRRRATMTRREEDAG